MARPLRVEYSGAVYHVTSRGNGGETVFPEAGDRQAFLEILSQTISRFGWICHAYCLMDNHYHLLLETPEANLSRGMRQLNGVYTQYVNRRLHRSGHLFQGRFKAILLEKESHLLAVSRYVVLNPCRAGIASHAEEWPWSSYRMTAGLEEPLPFLECGWLLSLFGDDHAAAVHGYRHYIAAGVDSGGNPMAGVKGQVLLGSQEFHARLAPLLADAARHREIPLSQRLATRPDLQLLLECNGRNQRNERMYEAVFRWGYSQREVADHLGLHYSTISRILTSLRSSAIAQGSSDPAPSSERPPVTPVPVVADVAPVKKVPKKRERGEADQAASKGQQLSLF
jgi:REP element-mobilizing transposase RayT